MNGTRRVAAALAVCGMLAGCSQEKPAAGTVDELTSQVASNLVERMKKPLEDARAVSARAGELRETEREFRDQALEK
jgi:outer membrane murein-binding lipoprotein Lpp